MAYGDFKDLKFRTASGEVLRYKAFNIAKKIPKYDGYQRVACLYGLYCFFIKRRKVVVLI